LAFGAVPHNIVEEQLIKDWLGPTGIVVDLRESKEYGEHEVSDWPNFIHYPITDLNKPSDMHSFHTLIKDTVPFIFIVAEDMVVQVYCCIRNTHQILI